MSKEKRKEKEKIVLRRLSEYGDPETQSDSSKPQMMSIKQYWAFLPAGMRHPHSPKILS